MLKITLHRMLPHLFPPPTVAGILSSFHKKIAQLEALHAQREADVARITEAQARLQNEKMEANADAAAAQNIGNKLAELVGGK